MNYFAPVYNTLVATIIGLIVGWLTGRLQKLKDDRQSTSQKEVEIAEALKAGMAILLKKQLFEYYSAYEYQESIPAMEWADIEQTHSVYNKLGGNHTGDRIYEEMKKKHLEG